MTGRDWDRANEREARRSLSRADRESNGNARSFAAKYSGVCVSCGEPYAAGEKIASTTVDGKRIYSHRACLYGAAVDLDSQATDFLAAEKGGSTERLPSPSSCSHPTKSGKPCRGGVKKGEIYCGPHLDLVRLNGAQPSSGPKDVVLDGDGNPF